MEKKIKLEKDQKEEQRMAVDFLNSVRGKYIIGQALHLAINVLEKIHPERREISNIRDMKLLRDVLFPLFTNTRKEMEKYRKITES